MARKMRFLRGVERKTNTKRIRNKKKMGCCAM
jgi:hypothetical protein